MLSDPYTMFNRPAVIANNTDSIRLNMLESKIASLENDLNKLKEQLKNLTDDKDSQEF
jgi:hypothetical protein